MKKSLFTALALIAMASALTASAETAPSSSMVTKSQLLDNLKLSYYGLYRGPQLTNFGSSFQPTAEGLIGEDLQVIENTLTAAYKLNPDVTLSANYNFLVFPLREKDMVLADPTLKISHTKLFDNTQGLTLAGAFRFYLPISSSSATKNELLTQLRTDETINQDIAGTKFSVGMDMTQRYYMYRSEKSVGTASRFYMYFGPYAGYQISEKLGSKLQFNKEMLKKRDLDMNTSGNMDGSIGLSWDPIKQLSLMPSVGFQPTNMKMNAMQFYLEVLAKFL